MSETPCEQYRAALAAVRDIVQRFQHQEKMIQHVHCLDQLGPADRALQEIADVLLEVDDDR